MFCYYGIGEYKLQGRNEKQGWYFVCFLCHPCSTSSFATNANRIGQVELKDNYAICCVCGSTVGNKDGQHIFKIPTNALVFHEDIKNEDYQNLEIVMTPRFIYPELRKKENG